MICRRQLSLQTFLLVFSPFLPYSSHRVELLPLFLRQGSLLRGLRNLISSSAHSGVVRGHVDLSGT